MTTTFIGIDLAWQGETNHSGIAVAHETERGAVLAALSSGITSFEGVASFVEQQATENTVVAIDAPLIITNESGRRHCESLISRKFGSRHASAHSSNLTLYPGGGPVALTKMLASDGFAHHVEIRRTARQRGRWVFEVYPHPASVVLFDLPKIIRYKKGRVPERRKGLATLRDFLATALPAAEPSMEPGDAGVRLLAEDIESMGGQRLKRYEDTLDAWLCAYLALYLWWWGEERNEMLGDMETGYIVVPTYPIVSRASSDTPHPARFARHPLPAHAGRGETLSVADVSVPVGTRIVTCDPVSIAASGSRLPAGAVGTIAEGRREDGSYLVRFPDSSVAELRREELSILRTVKGDGLRHAAAERDIDWNRYVIYRCIVGSRAYGLEDDESDTDRRGFFLPPSEAHWSLYELPEQIENDATQETFWEIEKFIRLGLKANPNILECLYTPLVEEATDLARELLTIRDSFLSKLTYQTYNGYVLSQFKKLEQDLRANGAIKWKHAMHLVRLLLSGITILREAVVPVRVEEHRERLLAIKRGEMTREEVDLWRLSLHREFDAAFERTTLPEQPDFERVNAYLLKARRSAVRS